MDKLNLVSSNQELEVAETFGDLKSHIERIRVDIKLRLQSAYVAILPANPAGL